MKWVKPEFSREAVDAAGRALVEMRAVGGEPSTETLAVVNNWRAAHHFPLNTFGIRLRGLARQQGEAIAVQRIKRLPSIEKKLERFGRRTKTPLTLSRMQDLGGCRLIAPSVQHASDFVNAIRSSRMRHELVDFDDYVHPPKGSGYRGWHLIYKYRGAKATAYDGLQIELQIRSLLQHAWATSVETVDTFLRMNLKGGEGELRWRRFFALMGGWLALREATPISRKVPSEESELVREIASLEDELRVRHSLDSFRTFLDYTASEERWGFANFFVLAQFNGGRTTRLRGFESLEDATSQLESLELDTTIRSVLVRATDLEALKKGYPNYFSDTRSFCEEINRAVAQSPNGTYFFAPARRD